MERVVSVWFVVLFFLLILSSPELDVMCFKLNEYWKPGEDGAPPTVLPFDQITSQIARGIIKTTNPELWITTTLDRVRAKFSLSYND